MKKLLGAFVIALLCSSYIFASEPEYVDMSSYPLYGTLVPDASAIYTRLPDSLENVARKEVWDLGQNSAGLAIRFRSDSPRLIGKWHSRNKFGMNHMTATGVRGLDLYVLQDDSTWTTVGSGRPSTQATSTSTFMSDMEPGVEREYLMYLSLYDGVDSLWVGIDSACHILPPAVDLPVREKPIVMYGTSILQGGCATRPGMAHTNILMRKLNREIINLGFSGNARLDPEIARFMAQADASLYVVDAMPNCTTDLVKEKFAAFIDILKTARPDVPILVVESPIFPVMRFNRGTNHDIVEKNATLREIYNTLAEKYSGLYYFEGEGVFDGDWECTVDNYHLTDYGFQGFANRLEPVIKSILNDTEK